MAKNWFPHDYFAKDDQKILELRAQYGAKGYGIWWMITWRVKEKLGN